jgi:hypothetical protein
MFWVFSQMILYVHMIHFKYYYINKSEIFNANLSYHIKTLNIYAMVTTNVTLISKFERKLN